MNEENIRKSKYGRKRLDESTILSERIIVRFNKSDYEMIQHLARSAGKRTGSFVRELTTKKISNIHIESKTDAINTNQLKKVGVNLNQISKNLNTYRYKDLPEFINVELTESLVMLKTILRELKK